VAGKMEKYLFGELCRATHEEGLAVFAIMDSNRAHDVVEFSG
jgi:hypothetical protein